MNPTESIRLSKSEIDTIVMGSAYNVTVRTLDYNKSKIQSSILGSMPSSPTAQVEGDDGYDAELAREATKANESLQKALSDYHTFAKKEIEEYPKKLALAVGIQSRLLKFPNGGNFTFTAEENNFVIDSLRSFEAAELAPVSSMELVIQGFSRITGSKIAQSATQTAADRTALQNARDEFICLMAKVINYGKTLATVNAGSNDQ